MQPTLMPPPGLKLPPGLPSALSPSVQHLAQLQQQNTYKATQSVFAEVNVQDPKLQIATNCGVIATLADQAHVQTILNIFKEMILDNTILHPSLHQRISILFTNHLKILSKFYSPLDILSDLKAVGVPPHINLYTTCLSIYADRRDVRGVNLTKGIIQDEKLQLTDVTLNVLRKFSRMNGLTEQMSEERRIVSFSPKSPPVQRCTPSHGALSQCSQLSHSENTLLSVETTFSYIPLKNSPDSHSHPSLIPYNINLAQATKDGNLEEASRIFSDLLAKQLVPDVRTYTSYILALLKADQEEKALHTFESMKQKRIQPDATIRKTFLDYYHLKIKKLAESKDSQSIEQLVSRIHDVGLKPNELTYDALIQAYVSLEDISSLLKMLEKIEKDTILLTATLFHRLISFFWIRGEFSMVKRIICQMNQRGFLVNSKKLTLLKSIENKENANSSPSLEPDLKFFQLLNFLDADQQDYINKLRDLIELNNKLNLDLRRKNYSSAINIVLQHPAHFQATHKQEAYDVLLWCSIRRKQPAEVFDILNLLSEQRMMLSLRTGFALVEFFFKHQDPQSAFKVAERMHTTQLLTCIGDYNYLLAVFVNRREIQDAWTIFNFMQENRLKLNTLTYHLLLDLYVLEEKFEKAENLLNERLPTSIAKRNSVDLLECYNCSVGYACMLVYKYVKDNKDFRFFFISTKEKTGYRPGKSVIWRIEDSLKVFIQKHLDLTLVDVDQPGVLRVENKRTTM